MNLREVVGVGLSVVELEEGADVFQAADVSKEADEDDVEVDVEVEVEVAVDGRGSREVKCEERLQVAQQVKFAIGSVHSSAVQSAALSPYSQPATSLLHCITVVITYWAMAGPTQTPTLTGTGNVSIGREQRGILFLFLFWLAIQCVCSREN